MFTNLRAFFAPSARVLVRKPAARARLRLECLESRETPAAFVVNTTSGDPNTGMGNTGSLPYCVAQANASTDPTDTITFTQAAQGTIVISAGLALNRNISIFNTGFTETIQRDPNAVQFSVFTVGPNVTCSLTYLAITGGSGFTGNGGGVLNQGTLTLTSCVITGNSVTGLGGGIYNIGTLNVNSTQIWNNLAANGAGLWSDGQCTIGQSSDVSLNGNATTTAAGGGIFVHGGTLSVVSTAEQPVTISNNTANNGGGVANEATFQMMGGTISGNKATGGMARVDGNGGGILNRAGGTTTVTGTLISGNSAEHWGGGVYVGGGTATFNQCDFEGNTAKVKGPGGAYMQPNTLIRNGCTGQPDGDFTQVP